MFCAGTKSIHVRQNENVSIIEKETLLSKEQLRPAFKMKQLT